MTAGAETKSDVVMPADAGSRKTVLCLVRYYAPGYLAGGPVRSIGNLVQTLGDVVDFRVVCLDRDLDQPTPYPGVVAGQWRRLEHGSVMYLRPSDLSARTWGQILDDVRPDVVYLNSLFDWGFSILPLLCARRRRIPTLLAPRGELSGAALGLKAFKKRLFLLAAHGLRLYRRVVWHASTPSEAADIQREMRVEPARVHVALNLPGPPLRQPPAWRPKSAGSLRVMFLSRVVRMKNLREAIRVVIAAGGRVELDIWGPVQDEACAAECRSAIASAPAGVRISWRGPIPHERVRETMLDYHLFLLPTLGESFGHVIYEALSAGLPVLISDRTPWRDLARHGVGAELPLDDPAAFVREIRRFTALDNAALDDCRRACLGYAYEWARANAGAERYRRMFEQVRAGGA